MTLLLSICYLACSVVEYSMINRFVAACFKNLLLDACMLTSSGNRLLYPSCAKLLRRQVCREFYRSQAGLNSMHTCTVWHMCDGSCNKEIRNEEAGTHSMTRSTRKVQI